MITVGSSDQQGWVEWSLVKKEDVEDWPVARENEELLSGNPIILALSHFSGLTHDYIIRKMWW